MTLALNRAELIRALRMLDSPVDNDVLTWTATGPVWSAAAGGTAKPALFWAIHASASVVLTLTNQSAALQFLANSNRNVIPADLSPFTQVRFIGRVITAGAANAFIAVRYSQTFSTTVTDYAVLGASSTEVIGNLDTPTFDSGWIDIVADAISDNAIFLACVQDDGDATADPVVDHLSLYVK